MSAEHWPQRVNGLASLPRLLTQQGVSPARVLGAAGLAPDALSSADKSISFAAGARALSQAVRMSSCPHLGMLVGQQTRLADLGSVGADMQAAPTVGEALRTLAEHQRRLSTGGAVFLQEHERSVSLGYAVFHPEVGHLGPVYDTAAGAGVSLMRELCGDRWAPGEVLLPQRRPAAGRQFEQLFRCPIRFDAEHFAMNFPASVMDEPPQRRPGVPLAAPAGRVAAAPAEDELLPQLYRSLRLLLLQGVAGGEANARALEMSQRTLGRRLEPLGVGFRQVLDDVRFGLARGLLGETDLPVVEIALTLGYAEASPFVRAFKRWSGMSPLRWRAVQRSAHAEGGSGRSPVQRANGASATPQVSEAS